MARGPVPVTRRGSKPAAIKRRPPPSCATGARFLRSGPSPSATACWGELASRGKDGEAQGIVPAAGLVNYAWRKPCYLLGSTLQNPSLGYSGISRQKRWCGLLFDDPSATTVAPVRQILDFASEP